jgi:hypothetical protein
VVLLTTTLSAQQFNTQIVDGGREGEYIAIDSAGNPHISYCDNYSNNALKYAK